MHVKCCCCRELLRCLKLPLLPRVATAIVPAATAQVAAKARFLRCHQSYLIANDFLLDLLLI